MSKITDQMSKITEFDILTNQPENLTVGQLNKVVYALREKLYFASLDTQNARLPADAPAPPEQEVGICNVESTVGHHCLLSSGHAWQHQDRHGNTWPAPAEQEVGLAPPPRPDEDGGGAATGTDSRKAPASCPEDTPTGTATAWGRGGTMRARAARPSRRRGAMGRKKIAPLLTLYVDHGPPSMAQKGAAAELRALLAVARAAKRCANDYDEEPYGLHSAFARLERAGKEGR